jgi:hypothetical protein
MIVGGCVDEAAISDVHGGVSDLRAGSAEE